MNAKIKLLVTLFVAVLMGCGKQPVPRHIVILPDVSGSIDRKALDQAFKGIDELVGHLQRGDLIAIIPILGDAQAEASGRIIRFQVPTNRQAYDSDLRIFRAKLKTSLHEMEAAAVAHPGSKTDILGSVALAEQEFQSSPGHPKRLLIILSDFIQEDHETDFRKDNRLDSQKVARNLAVKIVKADPHDFNKTPIYLGLLRSIEYAGLDRQRRNSIQGFWIKYFVLCGAEPRFVTDGSALLEIAIGRSTAFTLPIALILDRKRRLGAVQYMRDDFATTVLPNQSCEFISSFFNGSATYWRNQSVYVDGDIPCLGLDSREMGIPPIPAATKNSISQWSEINDLTNARTLNGFRIE